MFIQTGLNSPATVSSKRGIFRRTITALVLASFSVSVLVPGAGAATTTLKEHKSYGNICLGNVCGTAWGVRGKATSIDKDKQVRVYADRFLAPDPTTPWFTTTGEWRESGLGYLGRRGTLTQQVR